ncbi:MAG: phnH [Paenibacillus sp.]|jgi:alpha-D-ribose 1-methylphosphonate 5-triphosphate synthase subunit PhnH|nr:phnH [Paenibacillus sp.]
MPNVKEQTFDLVHDTQFIYRQLLDVMFRPGQISSIQAASSRNADVSPLQAMIASFALTLLDGEVSFSVEMEDRSELESYIRKLTFSRVQTAAEADYIFADGKRKEDQVAGLFSKVNKGTLIRPEGGVTIFIAVDGLEAEGNAESCWTLTGPGIQESCTLCVQGLSKAWVEERAKANAEYPMGVDLVLFTESGYMTALPRTTIMKEVCL